MTVKIKIIRVVDEKMVEMFKNEVPPYKDGSKRCVVKKKLADVYGAGFLLQNDVALTDKYLSSGEYEYKLLNKVTSQLAIGK